MKKTFDYAVIYKGVLCPAGVEIEDEPEKVEEPKGAKKTAKKAVKKNDAGTSEET